MTNPEKRGNIKEMNKNQVNRKQATDIQFMDKEESRDREGDL